MISIKGCGFRVRVYQDDKGKSPYIDWVANLDSIARIRIAARVARFEDGFWGDSKNLGDGLYEARFFFGPGYRIYFGLIGKTVLLLICGGSKASQKRDIQRSKRILKLVKESRNAN